LRVYVLTRKNKYILIVLGSHFLAQIGVALHIVAFGSHAAPEFPNPANILNQHEFQVCTLSPRPESYNLYDAYLVLELSFNTIVFAVTLITTFTTSRMQPSLRWSRVMQRDGFIYFFAIFSSTLIWLSFNYYTQDILKVINAVPCSIFTAIMVNRLYLSLKEVGQEHSASDELELTTSTTSIGHREHEPMVLRVMLSTDVTSTVR